MNLQINISNRICYILIMILLFGCSSEPSSETKKSVENGIFLKYNFEQGDKYELIFDVEMKMEINGEKMVMAMKMEGFSHINSVNNDIVESDFEWSRLYMSIDANGRKEVYDSDNPNESEFDNHMQEYVGPMIGARLPFLMQDNGKLISQPDYESLYTDPIMKAEMQGFNQQLEGLYVEYPDKKMFLNDIWNATIVNEGITSEVKYTFVDFTDDEYIFDIQADLSGQMEGYQHGILKIGMSDGMLTSSTSTLISEDAGLEINFIVSCKNIN